VLPDLNNKMYKYRVSWRPLAICQIMSSKNWGMNLVIIWPFRLPFQSVEDVSEMATDLDWAGLMFYDKLWRGRCF